MMKKLLLGLLLCLGLQFAAAAADEVTISNQNIQLSSWAKEAVQQAYDVGIVSADFAMGGDYTIPISREQLTHLLVDWVANVQGMTIADYIQQYDLQCIAAVESADTTAVTANAANSDALLVTNGRFTDTQNVYTEIAACLGIVNGDGAAFRPLATIDRAGAAAMVQRSMKIVGVTEANRAPKTFSDFYDIPRWAVEGVKFVSGRTDSTGQALLGGINGAFVPHGFTTIEQAILIVCRMQDSLSVTDVYANWRSVTGYDAVTLALTFGGDCTFGRSHTASYSGSFDEMYDLQNNPAYFFSGISEFFDDDLTMVNFEGTLTTASKHAEKTFAFKGRPAYAKILPAGSIDVVTLANNHSKDYLQQGWEDTLETLSPYVRISAYDALPIVTVKGIRIGFASNVGWVFDSTQKQFIQNAVKTLKTYGADVIVFNYHWGIERNYHSNATQQAIAHYCIDQGADLVIGNHPHVVQEVETYHGKQIAYSLGNLVFGGNRNPSDKNCLIFRQNFTLDLDSKEITAASYQAIPYLVSSVSSRNDYHPVKR